MALGALDENEGRWSDGLSTRRPSSPGMQTRMSSRRQDTFTYRHCNDSAVSFAWPDKAGGVGLLEGSSGGLTGGKRHGQRILSQRYSLHHRRQSKHITSKPDPNAANLCSIRRRSVGNHVGSMESAYCHDSTPGRVRWQQLAESDVGNLTGHFKLRGLGYSFECLGGAESLLLRPWRSGRGDGRNRFDRAHCGECGQQSGCAPSVQERAPCGFLTSGDLAATREPSIGAGASRQSAAVGSCGRMS